ncbi:Hypothetical_protein [Hexamita inflata]|uniref:Hypothetical_protein n=1 Tax=Hexamita inflata TaxID=28002 RepID=A0ABP1K3R0_9EUKA
MQVGTSLLHVVWSCWPIIGANVGFTLVSGIRPQMDFALLYTIMYTTFNKIKLRGRRNCTRSRILQTYLHFTKSGIRHSTCQEVSKNRISENRQAGFDRTADSFHLFFTGCFAAHRCFPQSSNSFRESVFSRLQVYQLGQN